MNTLDKFIATSKTFSISELDHNDLFINFNQLNIEYENLLNFSSVDVDLYNEINECISNGDIIRFKQYLYISMSDEKCDEISSKMSLDEKKEFCNLTKDYINLNMKRYKKEKSL